MIGTTPTQIVKKDFIKWNGWGPPTSEYQIVEYCRDRTKSDYESDSAFDILLDWMNQPDPSI